MSVVLPVYNAERFVRAAVESILAQTFSGFELIIINDGSTDGSHEILSAFRDPRITYIRRNNRGLAATLNEAITLAASGLIARQDNDDLSAPDRLQQQVNEMNMRPDLVLLGTHASIIGENGAVSRRVHAHPSGDKRLKHGLLFDNPFVHSSVMFRKDAWQKARGYPEDPGVFEDYALWSAMSRFGEIDNIERPLVQYREVASGMSRSNQSYHRMAAAQSKANITQLCPDIDTKVVTGFCAMVHEFGESLSLKESLIALNAINSCFSKRENVSPEKVEKWSAGIRSRLRRNAISGKLRTNLPTWRKLLLRIERRLLS